MPARLGLPVVLVAAALAGPARAQVYTWTDEQGTIHFSEDPPPEGKNARKLHLPVEEPGTAERPRAEERRDAGAPQTPRKLPAKPVAPRPAPKVDLYTTSWCPWCAKARAWFQAKGIAFDDHDIEADGEALQQRIRLGGGRGVPVAVIDGKVVRGYAPAQYQTLVDSP